MHAYQLARQYVGLGDRAVNPLSLAENIGVLGAHDNTGVGGVLLMKSNEVAPVQREHDPVVVGRERENRFVSHRPARFSGFCRGQDIVPTGAQGLDDSQWEVLVGVERCHAQAASLLWMSCSTSSRWASTYAQAPTRSTARSVEKFSSSCASVHPSCR